MAPYIEVFQRQSILYLPDMKYSTPVGWYPAPHIEPAVLVCTIMVPDESLGRPCKNKNFAVDKVS